MCSADERVSRGPIGLSAHWVISELALELVAEALQTNNILLTMECMPGLMGVS